MRKYKVSNFEGETLFHNRSKVFGEKAVKHCLKVPDSYHSSHYSKITFKISTVASNRQFQSSLVPLFQSESKWETILMTMTLICMKMKMYAGLIFI